MKSYKYSIWTLAISLLLYSWTIAQTTDKKNELKKKYPFLSEKQIESYTTNNIKTTYYVKGKILQIVNSNSVIAEVNELGTINIKGLDTKGRIDGDNLHVLVHPTGTFSYVNALGVKRTIKEVSKLTEEQFETYKEYYFVKTFIGFHDISYSTKDLSDQQFRTLILKTIVSNQSLLTERLLTQRSKDFPEDKNIPYLLKRFKSHFKDYKYLDEFKKLMETENLLDSEIQEEKNKSQELKNLQNNINNKKEQLYSLQKARVETFKQDKSVAYFTSYLAETSMFIGSYGQIVKDLKDDNDIYECCILYIALTNFRDRAQKISPTSSEDLNKSTEDILKISYPFTLESITKYTKRKH